MAQVSSMVQRLGYDPFATRLGECRDMLLHHHQVAAMAEDRTCKQMTKEERLVVAAGCCTLRWLVVIL